MSRPNKPRIKRYEVPDPEMMDGDGHPLWFDVTVRLKQWQSEATLPLTSNMGTLQTLLQKWIDHPEEALVIPENLQNVVGRWLSIIVTDTNWTEDDEGNPLPPVTDPAYWREIDSPVVQGLFVWAQNGGKMPHAAAQVPEQADAEAFTPASVSSSDTDDGAQRTLALVG